MIYLVLILISMLWGLAPLALKVSLRDWPPFTISFFRFLVASFFFLLIIGFQKKVWPNLRELRKIIIVSFFLCGNMLFYAYGIQYTTTISGALIYTVTPVLAALGGYFLYQERINHWQVVGIILAFIGVTLIIFSPLIAKGERWQLGSFYGNFFITVAAISFTAYSLGSKPLTKKYSPLLLATISSIVSLFVFLLLALIENNQVGKMVSFPRPETITAIVYLGLGATVATLILFQWTIKKTNAFIASLMSYVQPLITGLAGYFFLTERLSLSFFFGGVLVLVGVFFVTGKRIGRNKTNLVK